MSVMSTGSGYMSSAEIMLWMHDRAGGLYNEMREQMAVAENRTELAQDMKQLKAGLTEMRGKDPFDKDGNTGRLYGDNAKALEEFLTAHEGSPEYVELKEQLDPMIQGLRAAEGAVAGYHAGKSISLTAPVTAREDAQPYIPSKDTIDSWCEKLDAQITRVHEQDQRSLIVIGDLNSKINQAHQLASNLIASANQSSNAIIQNIKG
jgi:hypothetical protein